MVINHQLDHYLVQILVVVANTKIRVFIWYFWAEVEKGFWLMKNRLK